MEADPGTDAHNSWSTERPGAFDTSNKSSVDHDEQSKVLYKTLEVLLEQCPVESRKPQPHEDAFLRNS